MAKVYAAEMRQLALAEGMFELAAELLRFVIPPDDTDNILAGGMEAAAAAAVAAAVANGSAASAAPTPLPAPSVCLLSELGEPA